LLLLLLMFLGVIQLLQQVREPLLAQIHQH
jgi:hypothetical protein